jgi:hypothetical protein
VKTSPKRSYSVIENERFGLVFAKTVSIISATAVKLSPSRGITSARLLRGPPNNAFVAWLTGTTTQCHSQLYPPSQGLWIGSRLEVGRSQTVLKGFGRGFLAAVRLGSTPSPVNKLPLSLSVILCVDGHANLRDGWGRCQIVWKPGPP